MSHAPQRRAPGNGRPACQLRELAEQAAGCRGCDLWEPATQTVFGQGPGRARLMLVGEQPGDREDQAGVPFVGPAGRVLDSALDAAGLDRESLYLTNAVKHFKFKQRGKRRLHQRPNRAEAVACRPWLDAEIELVRPSLVVCLGAIAAESLLGPGVTVSKVRGNVIERDATNAVLVTIHPSAVLRQRDRTERDAAFAGLVDDLSEAGKWAAES